MKCTVVNVTDKSQMPLATLYIIYVLWDMFVWLTFITVMLQIIKTHHSACKTETYSFIFEPEEAQKYFFLIRLEMINFYSGTQNTKTDLQVGVGQ